MPRKGRWSPEEEEHLMTALNSFSDDQTYVISENHSAKWGLISMHIPGRTGKQCYDKYKSLLNSDKIQDILGFIPPPSITPLTKNSSPALIPEAQEELLSFVSERIARYLEFLK